MFFNITIIFIALLFVIICNSHYFFIFIIKILTKDVNILQYIEKLIGKTKVFVKIISKTPNIFINSRYNLNWTYK